MPTTPPGTSLEGNTQQVTVADLAALGEVAKVVVQALTEPQERIKMRELEIESKAIDADDRSERRLIFAVVAIFLSVAALAAFLILRNHEELAVNLIDRILYFLAGGFSGWGVAKLGQAAQQRETSDLDPGTVDSVGGGEGGGHWWIGTLADASRRPQNRSGRGRLEHLDPAPESLRSLRRSAGGRGWRAGPRIEPGRPARRAAGPL